MGKKKGKLVILSAPSGCGKTTVANQLTKEPNLVRSISSTTRPPRSGEKHGIDYFFISSDLLPRVKQATMLSDFYGSDHCPIVLELK